MEILRCVRIFQRPNVLPSPCVADADGMNGLPLKNLSSKNGMVAFISRSGVFTLFYGFLLLILFQWRTQEEREDETESEFAVLSARVECFVTFYTHYMRGRVYHDVVVVIFYLMLVLICYNE